MNVENLKTCRYCAEKINAAARICPRCRQWLTVFSLRNTTAPFWVLSLGGVIMLLTLDIAAHKLIKPGVDFSPYRNQLSITESRMIFSTNYSGQMPVVSVIGIVTNQSDLPWKYISFDTRFFDKTGTLIDVGQGFYVDTLYPHSDAAFRIDGETLQPFADYDSFKIHIGSADDPQSRL